MTREEAIKWFRENPFYHENHVPFNMAIKALEQEHVLDKIRAEIDNVLSDGMIHKKTVLGIIDKCMTGSEGKELKSKQQ